MISEEFQGLHVSEESSPANYYRLAAPRILPLDVHKVFYLDSDIVVRRPIKALWDIDINNSALAAVADSVWSPDRNYARLPPGARHFNSGVTLTNLDYWRKN
jgi:lipopolysaccharide biosynthesis glycosyltransferase